MSTQSDELAASMNEAYRARRVNEHSTVARLALNKARQEVQSLYEVTDMQVYKAVGILLDFCIDCLSIMGDSKNG